MKPNDLIDSNLIQNNFGSRERITRQVTGMRKKSLFPTGSKATYIKNHVTSIEAANLILILSTNPNPFNRSEFDEAINSIEILKPFLNDLALIFSEGGQSFKGQEVKSVSISLDRPYAKIKFADHSHSYGIKEDTPSVERFAILSNQILIELSALIKTTPRTGTIENREELLNEKQKEKL